jgi:hypothetical protein
VKIKGSVDVDYKGYATIMFAWSLSFLPCFGGKNASCNGHKNHEIECVVAS